MVVVLLCFSLILCVSVSVSECVSELTHLDMQVSAFFLLRAIPD